MKDKKNESISWDFDQEEYVNKQNNSDLIYFKSQIFVLINAFIF